MTRIDKDIEMSGQGMNFCSDNVTGASPEVLAALMAANEGAAMPYGADGWTQRLRDRLSTIFEREVAVFPVATGSAANALALSVLCPPYGSVYCHAAAHIQVDECGAPEFYTGGAKLVTLESSDGKIAAVALAKALQQGGSGVVHHVQPAAVSLTQMTEAGTVYSVAEVAAIAQLAHEHGLGVHMDGARFANALVHLNCTPAEITWKAGVDVLSLGATKNGAIAAEAVVFFNPDQAGSFEYRRKRGGHLFSKMRFLSAQLLAYLEDDLWLRNARHANAMAAQLAAGLVRIEGVSLCSPVVGNEIFARLPEPVLQGLLTAGFEFYRWEGEDANLIRLVTAFNTLPEAVERFLTTAASFAGADAGDNAVPTQAQIEAIQTEVTQTEVTQTEAIATS